jgi:hypothetical protein
LVNFTHHPFGWWFILVLSSHKIRINLTSLVNIEIQENIKIAKQILFYFILFLPACSRDPFSLTQRPLFLRSLPLMLQNLHYHWPLKQLPFMRYIDYVHIICCQARHHTYNWCSAQNNSKKVLPKKKRNFIDICWNCRELNSEFIKILFIVPTIGLLLEITTQGIHYILFPQLLKIHFEAMEPCFLEYINIWQTSTHSHGRYSMQLLNISCKE